LVAEAFDVVHAVGDDDRVLIEDALDGGGKGRAGIFLRARGGVDGAGESEGVVGDVDDFQALDSRGGGVGDFLVEVGDELLAAGCFAAGRV
jgi:hypothetical protein